MEQKSNFDPIANYWREKLPKSCPLEGAHEYKGDFYRFVKNENNITECDFDSLATQGRSIPIGLECQAHSLSGFIDLEECKRAYDLHNYLRKKFHAIIEIKLSEEDGKILKTPAKTLPEHYSWWVSGSCHPLERYTVKCILN